MRASLKLGRILLVAGFAAGLSGCGNDMAQLDAEINEVLARPGGRIEPLPEIKPYETFTYVADREGLRSPFVPDTPQASAGAGGSIRPNADRSREYLEQFPLDTLRMVGTLQLGEVNYGLVQTSDGLIHRVVPGNYVGQNDGRIDTISESEIKLVEIISDGIGGYVERQAAIGLAD